MPTIHDDIEPWLAGVLFLFVVAPHAAWLYAERDLVIAAFRDSIVPTATSALERTSEVSESVGLEPGSITPDTNSSS